jgi:hypothetical protein
LLRRQKNPFDDWPRTPTAHFKLYFFAAASRLLYELGQTFGTPEEVFKQYPFLAGYARELAEHEPPDANLKQPAAWWQTTLLSWEASTRDRLPLRALRDTCALDHDAMTLLLGIGLREEDARFGLLFESMQGGSGHQRPTMGFLNALWRGSNQSLEARAHLKRLDEVGLITLTNTELPRAQWTVELPGVFWDVMRGDAGESIASWARYRAPESLCPFTDLILPLELRIKLASLSKLFAAAEPGALIVRGPEHNGRRTLLGSVARELGQGLIEISLPDQQDTRWRFVGPLATMLRALPAVMVNAQPGETQEVQPLNGHRGLVGFVLGKQGGLSGANVEGGMTVSLEMPDPNLRRAHWQQALSRNVPYDLGAICDRFRLTGGNIRRAARLAKTTASLAGRDRITLADVREASRALNRQTLDTLATHIPTVGDWSCLSIKSQTLQELRNLELRCAHRERLQDSIGSALVEQMNSGVRALFSGPSGTGKTLAARVLSAVLQKDLYRLDLSTVVNKYIGETEKNLSRVFARAEELDVILLLDEGDALLTQRTDVHNANDRYANLETNYLLQRLESFEGILIVTTNAGDRIDRAFQRRMDIVISFPPPDANERWNIWQLHLPPAHTVHDSLLAEVAQRCELTGGQIRNATLHASLLAIDDGGVVTTAHLEAAVQREYFKFGAVCPLRGYNSSVAISRW